MARTATYQVAGPGSWRVEDDDCFDQLHRPVDAAIGNYSGGSISYATVPGASVSYSYQSPQSHILNLGTRRIPTAAQLSVQVDQNPVQIVDCGACGRRCPGAMGPGHAVRGDAAHGHGHTYGRRRGSPFYFDFLEIAIPTRIFPLLRPDPQTTLATDWDTLNSQALAPERTAWQIQALGFTGRANHYAGALWFYELVCAGQQYATGTITFSGASEFGKTTQISLGPTVFTHLNLIGDTPAAWHWRSRC